MRRILIAILLTAGALFLNTPSADAANSGIFVYGCTSDKKPARMRVPASLKDKTVVEAAFRQVIRHKSSEWFLSQKRSPNGEDWQNTLVDLVKMSGDKLPKLNPALVARSVEIGKRAISQKLYCGG